jgi:hypothetical protein
MSSVRESAPLCALERANDVERLLSANSGRSVVRASARATNACDVATKEEGG